MIKTILIILILLAVAAFFMGAFVLMDMAEDDIEQAYRDNGDDK